MGNYKFRLSDMIPNPNAWFYKLRKMGKGKKQTTTPSNNKNKNQFSSSASKPNQPHQCNPRKSYYFTRELLNPSSNKFYTNNSPEQPRKPSKHRTRRRTTTTTARTSSSSVSAGCSCRTTLESVWTKSDSPPEHSSSPFYSSTESESPAGPEFRTDRVLIPTESFDQMVSCACKLPSNTTTTTTTTTDIVIDVDKNSLARKDDKLERYEYVDAFSELELPPIITKPPTPKKKEHKPNKEGSLKIKILKEDNNKAASRKQQQRIGHVRRILSSHSVNSPGVKLRVNSPRIASRKVQCHGRKSVSSTAISGNRRSLSDSLAIVKSSFNPQKDFRESMVEMIVENNMRASKDLEDLLACYLSLNSDEYHDLIIKVFKQIWFDLIQTT